MSEEKKQISREFVVISHVTKEKADKEPIHTIVLKTKKLGEDFTAMQLSISGGSENLLSQFPLNDTVEILIRHPQTKLKV